MSKQSMRIQSLVPHHTATTETEPVGRLEAATRQMFSNTPWKDPRVRRVGFYSPGFEHRLPPEYRVNVVH